MIPIIKIISSLSGDIFFIKCTNDKYIVSLPLRGIAFYSNSQGVKELKKVIHNDFSSISPELQEYLNQLYKIPASPVPTKVKRALFGASISIILHQMCNFECSYCFAHEARSRDALTKDDIIYIFNSWKNESPEHKQITFIGGGEPTLNWDLLEWSIEYVRTIFKNDIIINLVTNGSLITSDRLSFLKKERVRCSLSFDILPDIQESQRHFYKSEKSSFMVVDAFLKDAMNIQYTCEIRCTITPAVVKRMTEMVKYVHCNYPNVNQIHFEHVTCTDYSTHFFKDYTKEFFKARAYGAKKGINIYNSISKSQGKIRYSFCLGTNCFVPSSQKGIIKTACHRVSSENDKMFDYFKDAEISNEREIKILRPLHIKERGRFQECEKCHAKWQCAGGCLMERLILSPKLLKEKCEMVRTFNKKLLEEQLNKQ